MYRRKKIFSELGIWYGIKYCIAYHLHKHCYISKIGKRIIKLKKRGVPLYVRMFSRDLDFLESIIIGKYCAEEKKCVGEYDIKLEDKFDSILDLGANIGLFTVLYAANYPEKKIIAVEPETSNFQLLKKNTKRFKNVICIQQGVWYRDAYCKVYPGRVIVSPSNTYSEGSFYIGECDKTDKGAVRAQSIESLMREYSIEKCFVKMDIEGAEQEIFEQEDLQWIDKCYMLAMETHEWIFKNDLDLVIIKKMREYGYKYRELGENKIFSMN